MRVTKVPPQHRQVLPRPVESARTSLLGPVVLSAAVHGVVALGMIGSVWLWGSTPLYQPPSHMVTLVDGPLTLDATQIGGDGKAPGKPNKAAGLGDPGEPAPVPPAPAPIQAEAELPAPQLPAPPKAEPEPAKEVPLPPKVEPEPPRAIVEAPKKPPEPKAELPKEPPKAIEPPKKPASPKVEVPKEEPVSPKGAMTLPKPAESKPTPAPPASSPTAVADARQAIERLRERQARETQSQAETARRQQQAVAARHTVEQLRERQTHEEQTRSEIQTQQQAAEQRLAGLRSRYGSGGTGGGTGTGGPGGSGPGGGAGGLGAGLSRIRLQAYQDLVRERVKDAWILPMPREEARKLQATAFLMVSREGQVVRLQLLQTSGNPLFDDSLLRAIRQASPLPPLPEDYQGASLDVEMRFKTD